MEDVGRNAGLALCYIAIAGRASSWAFFAVVKVVVAEAGGALVDTLCSLVNVASAGRAGMVDDVAVKCRWALFDTLIIDIEPSILAFEADIQILALLAFWVAGSALLFLGAVGSNRAASQA